MTEETREQRIEKNVQLIINVLNTLDEKKVKDLKKNGKPYEYKIKEDKFIVIDAPTVKVCISENYNFTFDKINGDFKRWGKTYEEDPQFSPVGPEILDLEISVNGCPNNCSFCYKSNSNKAATNMSFETFKKIIDSMSKSLTQIAFGITGIQTNPDFLKMMKYCREIGIVPNFTLSGIDLTDEIANEVSKLVGALAVSAYQADKNICYNTVDKFVKLGVSQTNIHLLVSKENIDFVYEVLNDRISDERLKMMGSIVFLGVKPKGRAKYRYTPLPSSEYKKLIEFCFNKKISIGFDSCSAPKFESSVKLMNISEKDKEKLISCSESCESSLFSSYINCNGEYWHCSFSEDEDGQNCVNCLDYDHFIEVWYSDPVKNFREKSMASYQDGCRYCHVFPVINN